MSVKQWVGTMLLLAIPLVNIILLLMWAFGKENLRRNYARASLILFSVSIGLAVVLGVLAALFSSSSDSSDYGRQREIEAQLNNDLEILELAIVKNDLDYKFLTGKIKNHSTTETYHYFTIEFNAYDKENSLIDTHNSITISEIPPNEVLRIEPYSLHNDTVSVKVTEIRDSYEFEY